MMALQKMIRTYFCYIISYMYEGTNTLIVLDDRAASRDAEQRTNELVNLAFKARHNRISVWVLTQQMTKTIQKEHYCISSLLHAIWQGYEDHF